MTDIDPRRVHAEMDESFVVFVVGMRINKLWAIHRWLPVFLAGARVRRERGEATGLLGSRTLLAWRRLVFVQYWASTGHLHGYAHDTDHEHAEAWRDFDERIAETEAVGIFHETYRVDPDEYETVYRNMPPHGLGAVGERVPATGGRETMRGRMGE